MKHKIVFTLIIFFTSISHADSYEHFGIPAIDREWFAEDYTTTVKILLEKQLVLPFHNNELFKKLTDTKNFNCCKNKNILLNHRLNQFIKIQQSISTLLKSYIIKANQQNIDYNDEVCELMVFTLKLSEVGITLINEFLPTIKKDQYYENRMNGLKQFNSGLTTVFVGAETSLGERKFYTDKQLSKLLEAMKTVLPTFLQAFSSKYKNELSFKLKNRLNEFQNINDKNNINEMIKLLSKTNSRTNESS